MITSMRGEIGKCIRNDSTPGEIARAINEVVEQISRESLLEVVDDIQELHRKFGQYGLQGLAKVVAVIDGMEDEDEEEDEDEDEDENKDKEEDDNEDENEDDEEALEFREWMAIALGAS